MKQLAFITCALAGLMLLTALNPVWAAEAETLLSPEEARQIGMTESEWQKFMLEVQAGMYDQAAIPSASPQVSGPRIIIKSPHPDIDRAGLTIETGTPTDLLIAFQQNGTPIDMQSLNIIAKKGLFSISLTERLKPYIQGNLLNAKQIRIPEGKYLVEISIADLCGKTTTQMIRLIVSAK